MKHKRLYRLLTAPGLFITAIAVYVTTELWLPALLLLAVDMVLCWQWFIAPRSAEDELPCSAVCCCYYLGDGEEGKD